MSIYTNVHFLILKLFHNRLYEPLTLQKISEHYKTKETLPAEAVELVKNSKLQLAGYNLCTDLLFSRFDLEIYSR